MRSIILGGGEVEGSLGTDVQCLSAYLLYQLELSHAVIANHTIQVYTEIQQVISA